MLDIPWLSPTAPPDSFPDLSRAAVEPNGLLAIGGDLSMERLEVAYRSGIFPWYNEGQPILWWSPDPRAILWPDRLHVSRRLRRRLRSDRFTVSADQAFAAVIGECAERRADSGTWITPEMRLAYLQLHEQGDAHSIETWLGDRLVGGVYGVVYGSVFFGESMFSTETDASKVALVALVDRCRRLDIELIDCQLQSAHLDSMGAESVPRSEFARLLRRLCRKPGPAHWALGRQPTAGLG